MAIHISSGPLWKQPNGPSVAVRRGSGFPNVRRRQALGYWRGRRSPINWHGRALTSGAPWGPWMGTKLLAEAEPPGGWGERQGGKMVHHQAVGFVLTSTLHRWPPTGWVRVAMPLPGA